MNNPPGKNPRPLTRRSMTQLAPLCQSLEVIATPRIPD
jgi:hypothetical protein